MGDVVVTGAMLQCDQGVAPATLNILPTNLIDCAGMAAGTVMDFTPRMNIPPFGTCQPTSNPMVTAAAPRPTGPTAPPGTPLVPRAGIHPQLLSLPR